MKFKKNLLALPLVAIIGMTSIPVLANNHVAIPLELGEEQEIEEESEAAQAISAISGTIINIFELEIDANGTIANTVVVETEGGSTYHFVLSGDVALIRNGEITELNNIQEGQQVTAYYDNTRPMLAIYPARITPSALVVSSERNNPNVHIGKFAYSDLFGGQLLSHDRSLRFELTEDTVVVDINNEVYEGSLSGRTLAVVYSGISRSMPAIPLNPKVIVLSDSQSTASSLFSSHIGTAAGVNAATETDFGRSSDTVVVHSEENGLFHFVVSENTMIVKNGQLVDFDALTEGDELNIIFESMQAIPMIFPPRLVASAIIVTNEEDFTSTHVDIFNTSSDFEGQLQSHNGSLRFEVTDETVVVDINNNPYTGSLENKKLGLIFSATTMSIPAIPLNPIVVVLGEAEEVAGANHLASTQPILPSLPPSYDLINMVELLPQFARGSSALSHRIEL